VVETPSDPSCEISLTEAQKINKSAQVGEVISIESTPPNAGRIAAQTARQVILQRLHEAEHHAIFEEFTNKEGDIVTGIVQRITPDQVYIDLGKAEAIFPGNEQVHTERYRTGQRLKLYVLEVSRTSRGPQIIVSRSHRNLLRRLFELEVPEIYGGIVQLKSVAREAGHRSKVAVAACQEGIDPVGCCVGLRGIRIQNIVNELNGEKIDVVEWSDAPAVFIANALSPSQVSGVELNAAEGIATVTVPDKQLSLAIGKEGQNARLAAKLTGWRIDIKSTSAIEAEKVIKEAAEIERAIAEAEALEVEPAGEEEAAVEAATPVDYELVLSAEIQKQAKPTEIRFAEDILPARAKAKAKKGSAKDTEIAGKTKGKKARPRKAHYEEEIEDEI
jgi:N utilization substance protein A